MPKKLTYEFVKEQFEKEDYTLLSKEYKNSKMKLNYRCPKGHEHSITWKDWSQGRRCPYCYGNVKCNLTYIMDRFNKEGYSLLSTRYEGSHSKLEYKCPQGHKHFITWADWQQGNRCPYCYGNNKLDIEFIQESFKNEDYVLLSSTYKNNTTKLKYMCPKGHTHSITWHDWQAGKRCPYCAGNIKLTIEQVRKSFEVEGYTLLTAEYVNNSTKLEYICPVGHRHNITWHDWSSGGYRCPYCAGKAKHSIEHIKQSFEKEGYTLLSSDYINSRTKLDYVCPFGHRHSISWDGWRRGNRCQTCGIIKNSGETHYNWQGGISNEGYCSVWKDQEYKQDIRERDGNICLNPYCVSKNPNDLTIHHIDYDKQNCHPSNLITVCRSCNSRANKDRRWHKAWYQAIIKNRYKEAIYV